MDAVGAEQPGFHPISG